MITLPVVLVNSPSEEIYMGCHEGVRHDGEARGMKESLICGFVWT